MILRTPTNPHRIQLPSRVQALADIYGESLVSRNGLECVSLEPRGTGLRDANAWVVAEHLINESLPVGWMEYATKVQVAFIGTIPPAVIHGSKDDVKWQAVILEKRSRVVDGVHVAVYEVE